MSSPPPVHRILFVCLGNICRSPAAEIIYRKIITDAGRENEFSVDSAGTIGIHQGAPPDQRMAATLERRGYFVRGNSRRVAHRDLSEFHLIVAMDETNLSDLRKLDTTGEFHGKIKPFVGFCKLHTDLRVPNPYYGGQRGFDHVIELLEDGCREILATFERI